jgi:hypothetical protein
MKLTVACLVWGSPKTTTNSIASWENGRLDYLADEFLIFKQEWSKEDRERAERTSNEKIRMIGNSENVGIAEGYKRLVEESTGDLFLFLENDWPIAAGIDSGTVAKRIVQGMTLLDIQVTDVVRYRHRQDHGYPLWTLQFKDNELSRPEHLLDCVHWRENPDKDFPQYIDKTGSDLYTTYARYANWTNNPTMFRTEWLRDNILPRMSGDIEKNIQDWWQTTSAIVTQGEGLFTHYRID